MKYLILLLFMGCATPRPEVTTPKQIVFKSKQVRIMECLQFVKSMESDDKFAGEFCRGIYKED